MKFKKVISTLLVAAVSVGLLAGCGSSDTTSSSSTEKDTASSQVSSVEASKDSSAADSSEAALEELTYPVDSDVTLKIYTIGYLNLSSRYTDFDDVPFTQGLEKNTGINVEWESVPTGSDPNTAFNLMLQDEELPDIIMGRGNVTELKTYLEDGILQDVTEYLPIYAPDYWEFINSEEQAKNKEMVEINGSIPCFIGVRETPKHSTYQGMVIRKDWLDELGLDIPTTIEELENVALAFKEEYGAVITSPTNRVNKGFVAGATGAHAVFKLGYYLEDGEVKCANTQDEWKNFLTLMKKWYDMGILDPNFSTTDQDANRAMALDGKTGIAYTATSQLNIWDSDAEAEQTGADWIGISGTFAAEGEPLVYGQTEYSTWAGDCGAFITTDCTEEELIAALQFLNYGYTEEGKIYWNFGEKGVSYDIDAEGNYYYTDLVMDGKLENAQYDYTGSYSMPISVQLDAATDAKAVNKRLLDAVDAWSVDNEAQKYLVPTFTYADDEQTIISDANGAMGTYVEEMALRFIVGEESLDDFDKFVETLYSMNLQSVLDIQNAAYQSYLAK